MFHILIVANTTAPKYIVIFSIVHLRVEVTQVWGKLKWVQ